MNARLSDSLDSAVVRYAQLVQETKDDLTRLDTLSGDGDFGENLNEGLSEAIRRHEDSDSSSLWSALVNEFLDEVGGTSGPLFGLLFHSVQQAVTGASEDAPETAIATLSHGLSNGLHAIQRVGEAQIDDRTLVDSLAPAVQQIAEIKSTEGFDSVVRASLDGAYRTRELRARRGRSSYVGDRAIGVPDPGAVGIAFFFVALGSVLQPDRTYADEVAQLLTTA